MHRPVPHDALETAEFPVELSGVWKVFGSREREAMAAILAENLGKAEALARFDCAIGVADVSLAIRKGEIFCIMGLSGSGKSTLVRHINRLIEPSAGKIRINGQDIETLSMTELRELRSERIGMVFQNVALLPHRSVRENVALPLELRGATKADRWNVARDALAQVQLSGWEEAYPHQLSGGMKQRVGLARAMAADPDILLMDEPFSALDPLIRRQLQDEFLNLARVMKKTTVFITHDLDEAIRLGDRIAIMRDGRVVQTGTPAEIIERPADDYVAAFVGGDPRIDLVRAQSISEPLVAGPHTAAGTPRVRHDATLHDLLDVFVASEGPVVVVDGRDEPIGQVTKRALLRAVQRGHGPERKAPAVVAARSLPEPGRGDPDMLEQAAANFAGMSAAYYAEAFGRLAVSRLPMAGFNWSAAAFGPLWAAARGLWGFFAFCLAAEMFAIIQIGRGAWSDLGEAALARAEALRSRSGQLAAQAEEAARTGAENAGTLATMAQNLAAGAQDSLLQYEAASARASTILLAGAALLAAVKLVEGALANRLLERQFIRWRVNRRVAHGFSPARLAVGATIAVVALAGSLFAYTVPGASDRAPWMFQFPANRSLASATGKSIDAAIAWISVHGARVFSGISYGIRIVLDAMEIVFVATPWPIVAAAVVLIAWRLSGLRFAAFAALALAYLGYFGFWQTSMETVALLGTASVFATAIGVPLGIWFGKSARAYSAAKPVLDFAQTMPAFVYLIPVIAFFGIGKPPAIIATLIFGMPPVIRLTALGLQQVPHDLKEAAIAFGADRWQLLSKVELPLSRPSIMAGVNQTTLMCLAMVVIASLIGAKGLGQQVLEALQYANKGAGLLAGLAILVCALILDRMVQSRKG